MTKVRVVNAQEIDGVRRRRGEVIDVSPGRARSLVNAGKAVLVTYTPVVPVARRAGVKGGKNG